MRPSLKCKFTIFALLLSSIVLSNTNLIKNNNQNLVLETAAEESDQKGPESDRSERGDSRGLFGFIHPFSPSQNSYGYRSPMPVIPVDYGSQGAYGHNHYSQQHGGDDSFSILAYLSFGTLLASLLVALTRQNGTALGREAEDMSVFGENVENIKMPQIMQFLKSKLGREAPDQALKADKLFKLLDKNRN